MGGAVARLLDAAPAAWEELLDTDPNATPAHRAELWARYAQTMGGMEPRFVAVEVEGGLAGGTPVVLERRAGLQWIHALPFLLPGAPLARPGRHALVDRAVGEALAGLRAERPIVGGEWILYRPGGPPPAPEALEAVPGETRLHETWVLELGPDRSALEGRWERDVRIALRRAREAGWRCEEDPEALEAVFALHLAQARRWGGHRPPPLALLRRLLLPAGRRPVARLLVARDPRGIASGLFLLDHPRELFVWWSGTRPEGRARHAMPFLYAAAAEWALEAGYARMNLGGASGLEALAAFKRSLGGERQAVPVRWMEATPGWPRAVRRFQDRLRRGRFRGAPA